MRNIRVKGKEFEIALAVFDKDGLLFESRQFWIELATARAKALKKYVDQKTLVQWLELFGVSFIEETVTDVSPTGILAVASPAEEITVTAGFLVERLGLNWTAARDMARAVFTDSDAAFRLEHALTPRKGFPEIFRRLREAGIPYGIATSDDYDRAKRSVTMFDDFSALSFVITPVDVKKGKPDPEMLELISVRTGVPTKHMMMLGDSYVDVQMAATCGAVGIGVPEREDMREAMKTFTDLIVENLDEIEIL